MINVTDCKNFQAVIFLSMLLACLLWARGTTAEQGAHIVLGKNLPQHLALTVGKSAIVDVAKPVSRVSIAEPEIADATVLSPSQIYLVGKSPGATNLTLWEDKTKITAILDLEVSADISRLKKTLNDILPGEDIRVTSTHDGITLSGTVSSTTNLSQALALAEPFAPGKVINLMEVGGVHQVMLEVRMAEMSRSLIRRLGFNFNYISESGKIGLSLLNNLTALPEKGWPGNPIEVSDSINSIFSFVSNDATWTVFIDALKEEGLVKILAEPTLITLSGQTASFLAGGEFPIPVPQDFGRTTIEYKPFGVGLTFTPTVLSDGRISMKVAPEASELDFSTAVNFSGFVVPGITTRRVSTVIELADGQSFAIAGLLKNDVRELVSKFPVLGELPVLGALFRSSSFRKNESELIVIVTPHLVRPLDMTKQTLPTDEYVEPDDFEFYLLGRTEGGKKPAAPGGMIEQPGGESGLEGEFGHIVPR